ncbi:GlcG/HbpS family heme-binding protein [Sneathiella aquimaris]|uniref:GlcG/HbpS family heme-binding protein n=1 Tax=Sneathiella aquimaris TaxID=2599305 RepID=UPI00146ACD4F|nr:heme-binding protein [Sneathiella aquimaris]
MKKSFVGATIFGLFSLLWGGAIAPAFAQSDEALVSHKVMTPEIAMELAQATLKACRKADFQVGVAVVDRFGILQAFVRDRYAGVHTPDTARQKAWTAVSFRTDTAALEELVKSGELTQNITQIKNAMMVGGGVQVLAAGSLVGAVGVSGAPGGDADDDCARKGIETIQDKLEF